MKMELLELLQCPGQRPGQFSFADTQTTLPMPILLSEPATKSCFVWTELIHNSSVMLPVILSCSFMAFWAASFYSSL